MSEHTVTASPLYYPTKPPTHHHQLALPRHTANNPSHYHRLASLAYRGDYLFRIWDQTSLSPLAPAKEFQLGGFTSPHPFFAGMNDERYRVTCRQLYQEHGRWVHCQQVRDSILRHTTGDTTLGDVLHSVEHRLEALNIANEQSPWITTNGSLSWATFEVCRRLAKDPSSTVHMTVIRRPTGGAEIRSKTETVLSGYVDDLVSKQEWRAVEVVTKAKVRAREAGEVLWYGRIFPNSILYDTVWTSQLSLPPKCTLG
jgi:hypothetical protein